MVVVVQILKLVQNEDEVGSLKNLKDHPWIIAYNGII